SFTLPKPDGQRFERSGAIAWVGYAAVEYLDAADGGDARGEALTLAHHAAGYLIAHQLSRAKDPRDGLVLGGYGSIYYLEEHGDVREHYEPGDLAWASVEHNVDSYFFLRALARITGSPVYAKAAERIAAALKDRAWNVDAGQLAQGFGEEGPGWTDALDCASWGSVFLGAVGEAARAETAA